MDFKDMVALFPVKNFPVYNMYMNMLWRFYTKTAPKINKEDMAELSVILGHHTSKLFQTFNENKIINIFRERSIICLSLKVALAKRISETGIEHPALLENQRLKAILFKYDILFQIEIDNKVAKFREKEKEKEKRELYKNFPEFEIEKIKKNSKAAKILKKLKTEKIEKEDFEWLIENNIYNSLIKKQYYLNKAEWNLSIWQTQKKPWHLVNASADFRKAKYLVFITEVLDNNYPFKFANKNKKLRAALLTTYGGVNRDLDKLKKAISLGNEAHQLTPLDYRPCTLLGASYITSGNFNMGHEWYEKAIERGFSQYAYNNELYSVFKRCSKPIQKKLKQNLISRGFKYSWLKEEIV